MFMNFKILKLLDLKFYFCAFCAFLRLYQILNAKTGLEFVI